MKTLIDFDVLKASELYLHTLLSRATGFDSGQHEVDINAVNIAPQYKFRLAQWSVLNQPEKQIKMSEVEAEQRQDIQRSADEARANQRLREYEKVGLEDTQENAQLIRDFVNNSAVKGYWSQEIVDAAIANLGPGKGTNQLTWKPKETPAPEPPAEPASEVEILEQWQLPLDADE